MLSCIHDAYATRKFLFFLSNSFLVLAHYANRRSIPSRIPSRWGVHICSGKYVYSDSLCLHRSNGQQFLRTAPVTSAVYFSVAISARRATFLLSRTSYATVERCIRSSRIGNNHPRFDPSRIPEPLLSFSIKSGFLAFVFPHSSSLSFLFRRRPEITVTYLVPSFPWLNRYRSRSRSCRNITLKIALSV